MNHSEIVSFLLGGANLIRDDFRRSKYQDVLLPLTVLRRLDCVLAPTKAEVLETNSKYKDEIENLDKLLRTRSGFAFYNTSLYDFERLLADAPNLASNLRNYINGFSPNMREVIEKFDFDNTITKLDEAGLLFQVLERFKNVDLHPDAISNLEMGTIFEELIRQFNEALNENPGEHFTPRDVVHLMAGLMLAGDEERIRSDPASCLTVCRSVLRDRGHAHDHEGPHPWHGSATRHQSRRRCAPIRPRGESRDVRGLQVGPVHEGAERARRRPGSGYGSTLSADRHRNRHFDYLIANPPYGKDWKRDRKAVEVGSGPWLRRSLWRGHSAHLGRPAPLFAAHDRAHERTPKRAVRACSDHYEQLTALHWRCRERRERDSAGGS